MHAKRVKTIYICIHRAINKLFHIRGYFGRFIGRYFNLALFAANDMTTIFPYRIGSRQKKRYQLISLLTQPIFITGISTHDKLLAYFHPPN